MTTKSVAPLRCLEGAVENDGIEGLPEYDGRCLEYATALEARRIGFSGMQSRERVPRRASRHYVDLWKLGSIRNWSCGQCDPTACGGHDRHHES
jgi:hypothetical protein